MLSSFQQSTGKNYNIFWTIKSNIINYIKVCGRTVQRQHGAKLCKTHVDYKKPIPMGFDFIPTPPKKNIFSFGLWDELLFVLNYFITINFSTYFCTASEGKKNCVVSDVWKRSG